jgi:large subunit ribosomal protein L25
LIYTSYYIPLQVEKLKIELQIKSYIKMKTIAVKGTLRSEVGKKSTKALRREESVPCVVYGGESNIHFSAPAKDFRDLIYTNEFRKASIAVDGKEVPAIVKSVQFHPVTDKIVHIDFLELVDGKKLLTEIPVRLVGSPAGVKVGGVLVQKVRKLKVKTTPDKLSAGIEVNVASLELGKSIRVREVQVEDGIQIMSAGGTPLASVDIPRALRSAQSATADEEVAEEA